MSDLRSYGGFAPRGSNWPAGCPECKSTRPERHPAVQCGGEVEICPHEFHLEPTPENLPEYIAAVIEKRARLGLSQ